MSGSATRAPEKVKKRRLTVVHVRNGREERTHGQAAGHAQGFPLHSTIASVVCICVPGVQQTILPGVSGRVGAGALCLVVIMGSGMRFGRMRSPRSKHSESDG